MSMSTLNVKRLDKIEAFIDRYKYTAELLPQYTKVVWRKLVEMFCDIYFRGKNEGRFKDTLFKNRYYGLIKDFKTIWKSTDKGMFSNKEKATTTTLFIIPTFYLEYRRKKYLRHTGRMDTDFKA